MFNFNLQNNIRKLANLIKVNTDITDEEYIINEINKFKGSKYRKDMIDGENYYIGKQDILKTKRMVINETGELEEVKNLPNNRIVDNQYKKMVNQKANYLLGQPITVQCDNQNYAKILKKVLLNKKNQRMFNKICKDSLNEGLAWLYIFYNEKGELSFKTFKGYECIPGWKDVEHTILDYLIRIYEVIKVDKKQETIIEKVEVYDNAGVHYFTLSGNKLIADNIPFKPYFLIKNEIEEIPYNWEKIPIIPFKYNDKEKPLITMVKSLQDGINKILSNFENNMEEDIRNTILVLVNYDGENLGEFRQNLSTYGVVKVKTVDGAAGDLKTLQVEVNADNYKAILQLFKKSIIENAMGYDAKDDRLTGNANQLNIQSMYSDIDLDANSMETEFQASFEELLWFINCHLANTGQGNFENEEVEIIFNRDMLINESEIIDNVNKSTAILSEESVIAQHPWVNDPQKEIERKKKEQEASIEQYGNAFNPQINGDEVDED